MRVAALAGVSRLRRVTRAASARLVPLHSIEFIGTIAITCSLIMNGSPIYYGYVTVRAFFRVVASTCAVAARSLLACLPCDTSSAAVVQWRLLPCLCWWRPLHVSLCLCIAMPV